MKTVKVSLGVMAMAFAVISTSCKNNEKNSNTTIEDAATERAVPKEGGGELHQGRGFAFRREVHLHLGREGNWRERRR